MTTRPAAPLAVMLAMTLTLFTAPARSDTYGLFDPNPLTTNDGQQVYQLICQGCHMADARGATGAGNYPALAGDRNLVSRQFMALTILLGRRNMPAFGIDHALFAEGPPVTLTTTQIAAVINYVRTHFGNHYRDAISADEVKALDPGRH